MYPDSLTESFLMEVLHRQASNPQDKYFAVISFLSTSNTKPVLDYLSNIHDIYTSLSIDLLGFTRSLNILLFVSSTSKSATPSWIVDWRSARSCWATALCHNNSNRVPHPVSVYPGATPGSHSVWEYRSSKCLVMFGHISGHITWCSEQVEHNSSTSADALLLQNVQNLLHTVSGLPQKRQEDTLYYIFLLLRNRPTGQNQHFIFAWRSAMNSLSRILQRGTDRGAEWVLRELEADKRSLFGRLRRAKSALDFAILLKADIRSLLYRLLRRVKSALDFLVIFENYIVEQEMALVTCSGICSDSGVAVKSAKEEDVVALISGVSLPMLLRQHENGYTVVGPAFLPEIVNGKVWESMSTENLVEIVLV